MAEHLGAAGSIPVFPPTSSWSAMSVDELLEQARRTIFRLAPAQAQAAARAPDTFIVDTRPEFQRRRDGEVPGAIVIERNHLEWRLHPGSAARIPEATSADIQWIVLC